MARQSYSVTVDESIATAFREICKEQNINQSVLIEAFMRTYTNEHIKLEFVNNKMETLIK